MTHSGNLSAAPHAFSPVAPTARGHSLTIGWEELSPDDQTRWSTLMREERLRAFEQDIEQLHTINQTLMKRLPWLLGGPRNWIAPLALPILTRKIRQYLHQIEHYGSEMQAQAAPHAPTGATRHLCWATFPEYDRYNLLRARALVALARTHPWFRWDGQGVRG